MTSTQENRKLGELMANFFSRWFQSKGEPNQINKQSVEVIHETRSGFTNWGNDPYANDVYRGAVDAIARNTAKLKPVHFINRKEGNAKLNRLLQSRPNQFMSTYDMLYKVVTHYFLYNNAFIYIQRDYNGNPIAFYPIKGNSMEFGMDNQENLLVKFIFHDGTDVYLPYKDIIHLRRNFNDNVLLGDDNNALSNTLEVAHTQNEGMSKAIKLGASLRGILSFVGLANADDLKKKRDEFISNYMGLENNGGVVVTDQKMNYTPLDSKPITIDETQFRAIETKIYNYMGINQKIVASNYNEDEWASFYESTIEPIATQLSMEFTEKCFTQREQTYGNRIHFESGRLQFSSNSTKIKLVSQLVPNGLLTINQALEVLNMPPIEGEEGNKRLQTLNLVDLSKANKYQEVEDEGD